MPRNDVVAELRERKAAIQAEMTARLDEIDRFIRMLSVSGNTDAGRVSIQNGSRRPRGRVFSVEEIIERPILVSLIEKDELSTREMAGLVPDKKIGPLVSAWKRRAVSAGLRFDDLVEKRTTTSGGNLFALTQEGRRVFSAALKQESADL